MLNYFLLIEISHRYVIKMAETRVAVVICLHSPYRNRRDRGGHQHAAAAQHEVAVDLVSNNDEQLATVQLWATQFLGFFKDFAL
jgi:hypothetical protein